MNLRGVSPWLEAMTSRACQSLTRCRGSWDAGPRKAEESSQNGPFHDETALGRNQSGPSGFCPCPRKPHGAKRFVRERPIGKSQKTC